MHDDLSAKIQRFYADGGEDARLQTRHPHGRVEYRRVQQLLRARVEPGSRILDVGGGTGIHARWLAADGHRVTVVDPVPKHVEMSGAIHGVDATLGDARQLAADDASVDVVLLFGPLYHLSTRAERVQALREARRVLAPGGWVMAAVIGRQSAFSEELQFSGYKITDFDREVLTEGTFINPGEGFPGGHFHTSAELRSEMAEAGWDAVEIVGIEGPTLSALRYLPDDPEVEDLGVALAARAALLAQSAGDDVVDAVADLSAHIMGIARR